MRQKETILIKKTSCSDQQAFKSLFDKYQSVLFKYIYYKTTDYALSQDIVQETFIKVWHNRSFLKPELSFFAYLTKISSNLLKDHFKHLKIREKYKDDASQVHHSFQDNPDEAMDFKILQEQIHSIAKKHLSKTGQNVFFLSRIEGKSNPEIAEMLNIPKKKVENQLYIALKTISKKLEI